jgi:2-oxoglutarate ferredoxin oxidoreductase subunit alpha
MMQARWGSHGDYEIIALSPNSPQECFDLTIKAFNLSEEFRVPSCS